MSSAKDDLDLGVVYHTLGTCGSCCIGQTECMVSERCKEHQGYMQLGYPEIFSLENHSLSLGHNFSESEVLFKSSSCRDD